MKILIYVIGTLVLVYISRHSLRMPRSHGFYRFFAWECILGLFLLNASFWFYRPFAWYQLISWTLLFASLIPLGFGVGALMSRGKPIEKRESDPSLLAFEKTTQLVTSGIYKYIRHPLYSSLLLLTWGIFFKVLSAAGILLAIASTIFLILTAKADEAECIQFFGADYQNYMKYTKRFIPFLF
ncbi:MAG: isoprenylcysteine carboxylmethyltransferase family protein [Chloroflexi bacterium]|nr:isoprenylcysteine carboxylmethyltransferase family protein [Chloroflexota bacterium]